MRHFRRSRSRIGNLALRIHAREVAIAERPQRVLDLMDGDQVGSYDGWSHDAFVPMVIDDSFTKDTNTLCDTRAAVGRSVPSSRRATLPSSLTGRETRAAALPLTRTSPGWDRIRLRHRAGIAIGCPK